MAAQDFNPQCVDHQKCLNPPGRIELQVRRAWAAPRTHLFGMVSCHGSLGSAAADLRVQVFRLGIRVDMI